MEHQKDWIHPNQKPFKWEASGDDCELPFGADNTTAKVPSLEPMQLVMTPTRISLTIGWYTVNGVQMYPVGSRPNCQQSLTRLIHVSASSVNLTRGIYFVVLD